jgi:putative ABC transport system ATP-binding protein
VLTVRELGVAVAGQPLLTGLDFELGPAERVAITGPSGTGKTTLLRTIAGLIDPFHGSVHLNGKTPAEHGWPQYRRHVMWVAQRPVLFDGTVRDNLRTPFQYASSAHTAFDERAAADLLGLVGTGNVLDQQARTLSEGQGQRVCLVRALLLQPEVLLLDEPTSALDADSRALVEALLERAAIATLMVTHDETQVARLAHRSIDLKEYAV